MKGKIREGRCSRRSIKGRGRMQESGRDVYTGKRRMRGEIV